MEISNSTQTAVDSNQTFQPTQLQVQMNDGPTAKNKKLDQRILPFSTEQSGHSSP